ncbi:MAG: universal stress protein [Pseudomonadota bacterium]
MYNHVVVPVSFDEDRDAAGAMEIAEAVMAEGGRISLLHVIEQIPAYATSYLPSHYLEDRHEAIKAELDKLAKDLPNATGVVVDGHSGRTILDWSSDNGADCIVIASHRPGMQDLLLGSTAHYVVRHAKCAVHVVR